MTWRRYLVVANQTLDSPELERCLTEAIAGTPRTWLHFVVPATRVEERFTWTAGTARAAAARHLQQALRRWDRFGARVSGEVGDEDPLLAARDALRQAAYDTVVISTLASGVSAWLRRGLVRRLREDLGPAVPVIHVQTARQTGSAAPARPGPRARPKAEVRTHAGDEPPPPGPAPAQPP